MSQQYDTLSERLIQFIAAQHLFFVATTTAESYINLSPKGMDSLRVLNPNRVVWLNVTGSGNETAAHIQHNPRMTILFTAFSDKPLILRLYGTAKVIHHNDPEWEEMIALFDPLPGARQIFDLNIELVQTSCGMSIPYYDYVGERDQLNQWAEKQGETGIKQYWQDNNQTSLDGIETNIMSKNG